jgi:hypothetical protein
MQVGFVALLDVLGFSALVSGDNADRRLQKYLELLEASTVESKEASPVEYVVFSDSIVLTSIDSSTESFLSLAGRCSRMLALMLENDIPLRGAISYGSYIRSPSKSGIFVAGRAIIDAYRFETAQNWVGIMLSPSIIRQIPDLESLCRINVPRTLEELSTFTESAPWHVFVQRCGSIPFHANGPFENDSFEGYAIVPSAGAADCTVIYESLKVSFAKVNWLKSIAPDPNSQAKYRKTSEWIQYITYQWENIVNWKRQLEGK